MEIFTTATKQECIKAARQHIRKLGQAERLVQALDAEIEQARQELALLDGRKARSVSAGGGGQGSPVESVIGHREKVERHIRGLEEQKRQLRLGVDLYDRARETMPGRHADAVHLRDFKRYTCTKTAMMLYCSERTVTKWEREGLLQYAMILLGMYEPDTMETVTFFKEHETDIRGNIEKAMENRPSGMHKTVKPCIKLSSDNV